MKSNHCKPITSTRWRYALALGTFAFLIFTSMVMAQEAAAPGGYVELMPVNIEAVVSACLPVSRCWL